MRFLRHSLVGVFLASMTLALLLYAGQLVMQAVQTRLNNERPAPPPRERVFAVNVVTAFYDRTTPVLLAFGQIQSRRSLELRTVMRGRVIHLADSFVEGGTVNAGEVLVQVDPVDAQAALERGQADLQDAEAEIRDAARNLELARAELVAAQDQADLRQRAFKRQQDLQTRGVGTAAASEAAELTAASARQAVLSRGQAVAQSEARADQAQTRLARARIALSTAQRDLDETTVRAAFDGTLQGVSLVEGRLVSANEKLAELVDSKALEVAFRISTAQYARLLDTAGDLISAPVTVSLDVTGADLEASGVIVRDSGAAGEGQSGRVIFARLEAAPGFKPGDFVTVAVQEPEISNVARVPASALDAARTILVVGPDDRLESLQVELVRRQGDDVLIRGDGLAGREVVTGRTPLLGAGIRVRPLRQESALKPEAAMLELSDEDRARLVASVQANDRMPQAAKSRVLEQLAAAKVPAGLVRRIETGSGG
ncbi:HlyD family efflux transporter periplasmic adaptor subunit [Aliisedimentitalea scapharcae]|uniref:HlyD family efflux transporter periplasmic adaptor subunit n=1 Tax=Aliisedimentitalea scapharcae TaxID=1524259 RepID=A0ABZ2XYL3_9RHOB